MKNLIIYFSIKMNFSSFFDQFSIFLQILTPPPRNFTSHAPPHPGPPPIFLRWLMFVFEKMRTIINCHFLLTAEGARQNSFVDEGSSFVAGKVNVISQSADPQEKYGHRKPQ